ncbi:conserved domain protein [Paenibacillus sp. HGF5]|nr:conserved domain protein [Paenibacillus sp. HGF5]
MAANKFKFGEELVSYQNRWDLQDAVNLKKLKITSSMNISFAFEDSADANGYIAFDGKLKPEHVDILEAFEPVGQEIELDLSTSDSFQFMSVNFHSPKGRITIVLPSNTKLEDLDLSTFSDNIQVSGASSKSIAISVKSGNININGIVADQLNVENISGSIRGSDIQASTQLVNHSGNVELKDMEGPLDIEVTSGNVNVGLLGVSSVNILCRSGNVKVQPDPSFRGFYDLKSLTGSISAPESLKETTDTIQVETYSGHIDIVH